MYDAHARKGNVLYRGHKVRRQAKHAGIFEWNPSELYPPWILGIPYDNTQYHTHYEALQDSFSNTYRVITPNTWPVDHGFPSISIKGRPLEQAIRDFILDNLESDQDH